MTKFLATIEIPVNLHIEADDIDDAEEKADALFAQVYEIAEAEVIKAQEDGVLPDAIYFGARYDDTEISEEDTDD